MTTIAYRDGMMCSDSRATSGRMIADDNVQKMWRLQDGSLLGVAGNYAVVKQLKEIIEEKGGLPRVRMKGWAMLVTPSQEFHYFEHGDWDDITRLPYYALGSGEPYALAAMDAGADARLAVRVAMGRDIYSGGKIKVLRL